MKVGLVSAGIAAGAVGAMAFSAGAATNGSGAASNTASSYAAQNGSAPSGAPSRPPGPGGSAPVRSDEHAVSDSVAATLKAAALKAVPGGTVIRVETDAGDAAYEVHMHKADGSLVTVKFDKNLAETAVEDGMGKGDPAPAGGPGNAAGH
jgi:hypothetical protein